MDIFERYKSIVSNRDAVVMEFGCNDGCDSLTMYKIAKEVSKSIAYFALEPDYRVIHKAYDRCRNIPITFIQSAIGDKVGRSTFYLSSGGNYTGSSSTHKPTGVLIDYPNMRFNESIEVPVVTWDSLFKDCSVDHIDFIWADIQGAERDMAIGGSEIGRFKTRYLYTEYTYGGHYENDASLQDILNCLPNWEIVEDYGGNALLKNRDME